MTQLPTPVGSRLAAAVCDREPLATRHYMIIAFTSFISFISLLFTFIGGQLSSPRSKVSRRARRPQLVEALLHAYGAVSDVVEIKPLHRPCATIV